MKFPFNEEFLQRLERMRQVLKSTLSGEGAGLHPIPQSGEAAPFRKHRSYVPGDEFRHIDWNLYGRLDRFFVREFSREAKQRLYLVPDLSPSMSVGDPAKRDQALRLCGAIGYLGLAWGFKVRIAYTRGDGMLLTDGRSGERAVFQLWEDLAHLPNASPSAVSHVLRSLQGSSAEDGQIWIVSDGWDVESLHKVLRGLPGRGYPTAFLQLLAEEEVFPPYDGRVRLTDAESGDERILFVGPEERQHYSNRLKQFTERWRAFSTEQQIAFGFGTNREPIDTLLYRLLALRPADTGERA